MSEIMNTTDWQDVINSGIYALAADRLQANYPPLASMIRKAVERKATPEQIKAYLRDLPLPVSDAGFVRQLCVQAARYWEGEQV